MELVFGIVASGCLGYLVTEINSLQSEVKELREAIIWIKVKLGGRSNGDRHD